MRTRKLGNSDLEVTEISLGSWLTYSGGVERDQTEACTRAAFDAGINFFDTANAYGTAPPRPPGARSSRATRATPTCWRPRSSSRCPTADEGLSAEQIHKQIDASLERLQTDHVDLYQCHRFDVQTPIEETMEALGEVVSAGKARYIGFSEWTPEQIEAGSGSAGARHVRLLPAAVLDALAGPRGRGLPATAREHGISQIVWSPLAEGVLTGKYKPGEAPPADSRAASDVDGQVHR